MSTSTEIRTPEEITEGTWRVRFFGRRENTGVIGGPRATLIIEIAGFSDVLPILARRVDGDTVIDEFTFQQFR